MRKFMVVLVAALLASLAAAYSLWNQLQAEREINAQLRAQPHVESSAAVTDRSSASASPNDPAPRVTPAVDASPGSPSDASRVALGREPDWRSQQSRLMKDPRYVEALREQRRLTYRLRRDNAMRLFGFSRETADAIIELDIDNEIRMMPIDPAASPDVLRQQFEDARRDHDDKVLALLGQDRFDRWQTYMETRGTRMQVDRFRSQLDGVDALRDDQVEPLITALATEQKQMRADLDEYRDTLSWDGDTTDSQNKYRQKQIEVTKAAHKRMLANAASVLSASQTKRLEDMLNFDLQQRAMQDRMESLRNRIGPAPTPDAGAD